MEFDIRIFFENLFARIQVSLTSDENDGYWTYRCMYIYDNICL